MTSILSAEARKQVTEALVIGVAAARGVLRLASDSSSFTGEQRTALAEEVAKTEAALTLLASLPEAPAVEAKPVAWMWQHEETGNTGFVQHDSEVALRQWERMNHPRKIVRPLYASPQLQGEVSDARRLDWLGEHCDGASDSERYLPFRVWWGKKHAGNTNTIRSAIDAAMKGQP